jgi:hypothetical protein
VSLLALIIAALTSSLPAPVPTARHGINPETVRVELRYVCGTTERVVRYERRKQGGEFVLTSIEWAGRPLTPTQIEEGNRRLQQISVGDIHPQCDEGCDELLASGSKDGKRALMVLWVTPERITGSDVIRSVSPPHAAVR